MRAVTDSNLRRRVPTVSFAEKNRTKPAICDQSDPSGTTEWEAMRQACQRGTLPAGIPWPGESRGSHCVSGRARRDRDQGQRRDSDSVRWARRAARSLIRPPAPLRRAARTTASSRWASPLSAPVACGLDSVAEAPGLRRVQTNAFPFRPAGPLPCTTGHGQGRPDGGGPEAGSQNGPIPSEYPASRVSRHKSPSHPAQAFMLVSRGIAS